MPCYYLQDMADAYLMSKTLFTLSQPALRGTLSMSVFLLLSCSFSAKQD